MAELTPRRETLDQRRRSLEVAAATAFTTGAWYHERLSSEIVGRHDVVIEPRADPDDGAAPRFAAARARSQFRQEHRPSTARAASSSEATGSRSSSAKRSCRS
jgi:hypothetical protein